MSDPKTERFFSAQAPEEEIRKRPIQKDRSAVRAEQWRQSQKPPVSDKRAWWMVGIGLLIIVAIVAGLLTIILNLMKGDDSMNSTTPTTTTTSSKGVADQALVADNAACDGHTVKLLAHPGGNFGPEPLPKDAPDAAKQKILDIAKSEPTFLYGYYIFSPINGKYPEVKGPADLVDKMDNGSCFSAIGKKLYDDWSWWWTHAELTPRDSMPAFGTVTGATQAGEVFQQSGKINESYGYDVSYPGAGKQYDHGARGLCDQPFKAGVSSVPGAIPAPPEAPPLVVIETPQPPPPVCEGPGCYPVEQCPPGATLPYPQCFPTEQCPPGATLPYPQCFPPTYVCGEGPYAGMPYGIPPVCKTGPERDPATAIPSWIPFTPVPLRPQDEEPVTPRVPRPTITTHETPAPPPVSIPSVSQGGPTQSPSPRPTPTQTVEPSMPTAAPTTEDTCVPAPGKTSC